MSLGDSNVRQRADSHPNVNEKFKRVSTVIRTVTRL